MELDPETERMIEEARRRQPPRVTPEEQARQMREYEANRRKQTAELLKAMGLAAQALRNVEHDTTISIKREKTWRDIFRSELSIPYVPRYSGWSVFNRVSGGGLVENYYGHESTAPSTWRGCLLRPDGTAYFYTGNTTSTGEVEQPPFDIHITRDVLPHNLVHFTQNTSPNDMFPQEWGPSWGQTPKFRFLDNKSYTPVHEPFEDQMTFLHQAVGDLLLNKLGE